MAELSWPGRPGALRAILLKIQRPFHPRQAARARSYAGAEGDLTMKRRRLNIDPSARRNGIVATSRFSIRDAFVQSILVETILLWTAPPPALSAMDVGAVEAPTIGGAKDASDYDRLRHREICFPSSWHRRGRQCNCLATIGSPPRPRVLYKPPPCLVGIEACIKIADIVPDQIDDMKNFSSTRDSGGIALEPIDEPGLGRAEREPVVTGLLQRDEELPTRWIAFSWTSSGV